MLAPPLPLRDRTAEGDVPRGWPRGSRHRLALHQPGRTTDSHGLHGGRRAAHRPAVKGLPAILQATAALLGGLRSRPSAAAVPLPSPERTADGHAPPLPAPERLGGSHQSREIKKGASPLLFYFVCRGFAPAFFT